MACDLQFTYSGSVKFKGTTKIITLNQKHAQAMFGVDKAFIGFCGNADRWASIVSWFADPEGRPPKMKGVELLMLTSSNEIFHASSIHNWLKLEEPHFAIGSGMSYAMAAMHLDKSPTEAIKAAMKYDINTGMGVKTYKL